MNSIGDEGDELFKLNWWLMYIVGRGGSLLIGQWRSLEGADGVRADSMAGGAIGALGA